MTPAKRRRAFVVHEGGKKDPAPFSIPFNPFAWWFWWLR